MEQQNIGRGMDLLVSGDRGFSLPDMLAVAPMPPTKPCKKEEIPLPEKSTDNRIGDGSASSMEKERRP